MQAEQDPGKSSLADVRAEVERASRSYYHTPLQQGIDNRTRAFVVERCLPSIRGPRVLELGYVDGLWTDALVAAGHSVDVVEGASRHIAHARERFGENANVNVHHALFQEFEPDRRYDSVVAGDMLRYLDEPVEFLRRVRGWVRPDGVVVVTVPNSRSLHRRVGALMGMERSPTDANRRDVEVGNRRSYDRYELRGVLTESGFTVTDLSGCFLKPLSSEQMQDWSDELLRAFLEVGDELQDYCWFIYAVCRPAHE
jgi:2-polyprenyl-3-methyl-5-hydroxy-6-metoxy-1,4-benzoquinol methylase